MQSIKHFYQVKLCPALESRWFLIACLIIAFALRLVWALAMNNEQTNDYAWYFDRGMSIAEGNGYSVDGSPTAFFPVGYPAFLGLLFAIFEPSETLAKLANIILYMGIIVLSAALTRELFKSRVAAGLTALILTFYPNHIAYSALLVSETLFTFLVLLGVWLIIRAKEKAWIGIVAGIVLGYSALTRQQGLLVPAIAIILFAKHDWKNGLRLPWIKLFVIVHIGMMMTILPWTVRNYTVFKHFVPISLNPGVNLLMGNNPYATGSFSTDPRILELVSGGTNEWEWNQLGQQYAVNYIKTHPMQTLKLLPKKLFYTFSGDTDSFDWIIYGTRDGRDFKLPLLITKTYYRILMLIFFTAMCLYVYRRRGNATILPLPTLGLWLMVFWTAMCLVTFGENRFHYPMMPWIIMYITAMVGSPVYRRKPAETTVEPVNEPATKSSVPLAGS